MCLDIKNFYLTVALDYYEYMKIPLALFPEWIKKQYNLDTHARDGLYFWKYDEQCGVSRKLEYWQTNYSASDSSHTDITSVSTLRDCGDTQQDR